MPPPVVVIVSGPVTLNGPDGGSWTIEPKTQAEWLIRHERPREAVNLVRRVLDVHPGHTKALTLIQGMLEAPAERYANMRQLRDLAKSEILQIQLGEVLWYNELLGLPEFCVMADLVERLAADPGS